MGEFGKKKEKENKKWISLVESVEVLQRLAPFPPRFSPSAALLRQVL